MELKIKTESASKKITLNEGIVSITSLSSCVFDNLKNDYKVVEINNDELYFLYETPLEEINAFSKYPEFGIISDLIKIIGYKNTFLDKKIKIMSNTEKIILNIFRNISREGDLILFRNVFLGLDSSMQKNVVEIIKYLINNNYTVLVSSDDRDVLYNISNYSIIASDKSIYYDKTNEIYTNVDLLNKCNIEIPTLSYITYRALKDKKVKLFYSKDVRDIIKDIYKHV